MYAFRFAASVSLSAKIGWLLLKCRSGLSYIKTCKITAEAFSFHRNAVFIFDLSRFKMVSPKKKNEWFHGEID